MPSVFKALRRAAPFLIALAPSAAMATDTYLGLCVPNTAELYPSTASSRIVLLARYSPQGGLVGLTEGEWDSDTLNAELKKTLGTVSKKKWHSLTPQGAQADLKAGAFREAQIVQSTWDRIPLIETTKIVLGACEKPGTIFSTEPIERVSMEKVDSDRTKLLTRAVERNYQPSHFQDVGEPDYLSAGAITVGPKNTFEEIHISLPHPHKDHLLGFWAFFKSPSLTPVYQIGQYDRPDSFSDAHGTCWAKLKGPRGVRFAFVPYDLSTEGGGAGSRVLAVSLDPKGQTKIVDSMLEIAPGTARF